MVKTIRTLVYVALPVFLFFVLFAIFRITPFHQAFKFHSNQADFVRRFLALFGFCVLFLNIFNAEVIKKENQILFWLAYLLVLGHFIFYLFFRHFAGMGFDPFYVFTQFCLYCQTKFELYVTFGRVSFWLLTFYIFLPFFKIKRYAFYETLIFIIFGVYCYFVFLEFSTFPFILIGALMFLFGVYKLIFNDLSKILIDFKNWLGK